MMETDVSHPYYNNQKSMVVELRSVCGYSGSPVFCMPSMHDTRTGITYPKPRYWLLGMHWGHVTEHAEVQQKIIQTEAAALRDGERRAQYIAANTGMNGVVASWHIAEFLERKFRNQMDENDIKELRRAGGKNSGSSCDDGI
jgi:hypothetical protein